jgi:hypothetical protein
VRVGVPMRMGATRLVRVNVAALVPMGVATHRMGVCVTVIDVRMSVMVPIRVNLAVRMGVVVVMRVSGRASPNAVPMPRPVRMSHGKRSYRPRSRAVQRLAATGLSSEAFQLAWADGCATGLRTRSRHDCDCDSAS